MLKSNVIDRSKYIFQYLSNILRVVCYYDMHCIY